MLSKISVKTFSTFVGAALLLLMVGSALAAPIIYIYDDLNRLRRVEYPDGTVIKYDYDKLGNRTYMETSGTPHLFIAATAGANGTISPSGNVTVNSGAIQNFTVTPNAGYQIVSVTGCGVTLSGSTYTTGPITMSCMVNATFSMIPANADFSGSPTSGTAPLTVNFTDISAGNPTAWQWNFGDGATSTVKNPSHTYNDAGTYTISLTASNADGSNTRTKTSYVIVQSCSNMPFRIAGSSPTYYATLQAAYNGAPTGAVIQAREQSFVQSLVANRPVNVSIQGGFTCDFASGTGMTTLKGMITTSSGTVTIKNIILQK